MDQERRHDSLAPKGAFAGKDAAESDRAAAQTATLVPSGREQHEAVAASDSDDTDTEISIVTLHHDSVSDDDLCADELIPVSTTDAPERVSMEDAMRALIQLRLERSRPSDDFGAFELSPESVAPLAQRTSEPVSHSLAPIELSRVAPTRSQPREPRKLSPMPMLAVAAIALLAVGVYRRTHHEPSTDASAVQTAAQPPATAVTVAPTAVVEAASAAPEATAEVVAAAEIEVLGTSESEYATLTLGTPTILYIPEEAEESKPRANRHERTAKHAVGKDEIAAKAAPVAPSAETATPAPAAHPETPSREAILDGFNSVREEVLVCANGGGGVAPIEATIVSDGHVIHATVGGYYQGTTEGSCIARALRSAKFPPFARESIKVAFPYTL